MGALVVAAGVIGWNWPQDSPTSEEEERAFEREHGVPVRAGGSDVMTRWGMGLAMMFTGIAFATFLLAYFYLRIEHTTWPPPGVPSPGFGRPGLSAVLVVAGGLAARAALTATAEGRARPAAAALALALPLAVGAAGLQLTELRALPFGASSHAYGSIVFALGGFNLLVASAVAVLTALALLWTVQERFTPRRHVHLTNTARLWGVLIAVWLLGGATVVLGPYLT